MIRHEPNKYLHLSNRDIFREALADLVKSRSLGWRLFRRDFTARYKQSILGVLWVVLSPALAAGVFVILNSSGILQISDTGIPYVLFAYFGTTCYSLFSGIVVTTSKSIQDASSFVGKIYFPRIALIYSPMLTSLLDFAIRASLFGVVLLIIGGEVSTIAWTVPLLLVPMFMLGLGVGMIFAILAALFKDIPQFLNVGLNILMYLTPVMYPLPEGGMLRTVNLLNPLHYYIEVSRSVFFFGEIGGLVRYSLVSLLSAAVFLAGWRFYQIAVNRIIEKV